MNVSQKQNSDYTQDVLDKFFTLSGKVGSVPEAKAVMVDMEPKVSNTIS